MNKKCPANELLSIHQRYERRKGDKNQSRYNYLDPSVYMSQQEKERCLIRWIQQAGLEPLNEKRLLEIGCGSGVNLMQFLRFGFKAENLMGNELLEERAEKARRLLPAEIQIQVCDANIMALPEDLFDVVYQSTVFSSILDQGFQKKLADKMWSLVKPGGGVLWYDFIFDNPKNSDVKGVPVSRILKLFPCGKFKVWKLTLAPPISRMVTKIHPSMYSVLNIFPILRTHVLCWIQK